MIVFDAQIQAIIANIGDQQVALNLNPESPLATSISMLDEKDNQTEDPNLALLLYFKVGRVMTIGFERKTIAGDWEIKLIQSA